LVGQLVVTEFCGTFIGTQKQKGERTMNVSLSDNDVEILDDDVEIFEEIIDETTGKKQIIQLWPKVGSNSGSSMEVDGKICDANHSENVILTNSQPSSSQDSGTSSNNESMDTDSDYEPSSSTEELEEAEEVVLEEQEEIESIKKTNIFLDFKIMSSSLPIPNGTIGHNLYNSVLLRQVPIRCMEWSIEALKNEIQKQIEHEFKKNIPIVSLRKSTKNERNEIVEQCLSNNVVYQPVQYDRLIVYLDSHK
jgi:hypothetical protein